MSFIEQSALSNAPERRCPDRFGGLLAVFPAGGLDQHERAGYRFRPSICGEAIAYDPDYCVPGDLKKDPDTYGPEKEAVLGLIQSAVNCTVGATLDELREEARRALEENLERAIEADLIAFLVTNTTDPLGGPFDPKCGLAEAAQFLATSSECGRGLILGPVGWFVQLEETLVWQPSKGYHTDYVGNIVIPHSLDNSTVFALDLSMEIKTTDIQILDETFPGTRLTNDRVVRAEMLYTVAVDACVIGSLTVNACCGCGGGGGGGGGGNVTVDNLCSCVQDVNITGSDAPIDVNVLNPTVDVEQMVLCDVLNGETVGFALAVYEYDENGAPTGPPTFVVPGTNTPYVIQGALQICPQECCPLAIGDGCWDDGVNTGQWTAIRESDGTITLVNPVDGSTVDPADVVPCAEETVSVSSEARLITDAGPAWTLANDVPTGSLTSLTVTGLTGTFSLTDSNGTILSPLPAGLSLTWETEADSNTLIPPQSISADTGGSIVVNWSVRI